MQPFKIPQLPLEPYNFLKKVRTATGASQWHVLLAGLRALELLGKDKGLEVLNEVLAKYPAPK